MKPDGVVFDRVWRQSVTVLPIERKEADLMIRRHYLGRWPGVCMCSLALWRGGIALGVIVFSLPPRETTKRYGGTTWELARLWVEDAVPTNAETFLIAKAVRFIKTHFPSVRFLVSYADPSVGHTGTIYKAANWLPDGRTDQERKTPRFDYVDALTGKHYSRRGHVPEGREIRRVPRVSKYRFFYSIPRRSQEYYL